MKFVIIITIIHLCKVDRSKSFYNKNIYIAVAMPLNDKDDIKYNG